MKWRKNIYYFGEDIEVTIANKRKIFINNSFKRKYLSNYKKYL